MAKKIKVRNKTAIKNLLSPTMGVITKNYAMMNIDTFRLFDY
jgi:hypothetical protein